MGTAPFGEPEVRIRAADEGVPMLGAVLAYGQLVAPLQQAWMAAHAHASARLRSRFGTTVAAIKALSDGVEVDAGIAERFDLAIVAEGGVFGQQTRLLRNSRWPTTTARPRGSAPSRCKAARRGWPASASRATARWRCCPCRRSGHGRCRRCRAALVWCVPATTTRCAR